MSENYCKVDQIGPVCCEDVLDNTNWRSPNPFLFSNIATLWDILQLVAQDWGREAMPYQANINNASSEGQRIYYLAKAFQELPTVYLKCIFSYVMFFVALEGAYDLFFAQLNKLNRLTFLGLEHARRPKRTDYIEKVRLVRNLSIAHIGSGKGSKITSKAAMMWEPVSLRKKEGEIWDINKMQFGSFRLLSKDASGNMLEQSEDLEINGVIELHQKCTNYLHSYDEVCANYLEAIISKLPVEIDNVRYYAFRSINDNRIGEA